MLSFSCSCHKFSTLVNRKELMLLLLLHGDVFLNPGPVTLGVLNPRSIRNKGTLFAVIVASNDLDILCLTETHVHPFDPFFTIYYTFRFHISSKASSLRY